MIASPDQRATDRGVSVNDLSQVRRDGVRKVYWACVRHSRAVLRATYVCAAQRSRRPQCRGSVSASLESAVQEC